MEDDYWEEDELCAAHGCPEPYDEMCEECGGHFCLFHMSGEVCDWCYEVACEQEEATVS